MNLSMFRSRVGTLVKTGFVGAAAYAGLMGLGSTAQASHDVIARHCEIFIDKLTVSRSSHAYTVARLFVKVVPERLDGSIVRVGVVEDRVENRSDRPPNNFVGRWSDLNSFLGADDYFEFGVETGHNWMSATSLASFFVETTNGTRYWANFQDAPGRGFTIDSNLVREFERYVRPSYAGHDVGLVPKSADFPEPLARDINPRRCR